MAKSTDDLGRTPGANRWLDPLPIPWLPDGFEVHEVEVFRGDENRMLVIGAPFTVAVFYEVDGVWQEPGIRDNTALSMAKLAVIACDATIEHLRRLGES